MTANLENSTVAPGLKQTVFLPISKKGNAKECSNYRTISLISHASKVMLTILQARLQQYMNCELPDCREQVWGLPPVISLWGRKVTYARCVQTSGTPLQIPTHVPQQKSAGFFLCLSTPLTFSGKSQFRALVFCIWKSVSIQKPLWWLSSLPAGLELLSMWLRPPDRRSHRKLKAS